MDWTLEVVVVPVSDIERSAAFYRDQVGFHLDHDTQNEHMHVVQLDPAGVRLLDRVRRPSGPEPDATWFDESPAARRLRRSGCAHGAL